MITINYGGELMEKYNIKIKTKKGTYEYEQEDLTDIGSIIKQHPDYEGLEAHKEHKDNTEKTKKLVKTK